MANPRPTFQQRLFADEDLPLPLHDQIVRWADLTLKQRPSPILKSLSIKHKIGDNGECYGWHRPIVEEDLIGSDPALKLATRSFQNLIGLKIPHPAIPKIEVPYVKWEPILKDDRGTIVGAVDLLASIKIRNPIFTIKSHYIPFSDRLFWTRELLKNAGDFLIADDNGVYLNGNKEPLPDFASPLPASSVGLLVTTQSQHIVTEANWETNDWAHEYITIYIEAKTKIKSAGDLLRQINLYRSVTKSTDQFLVIAPASAWDPDLKCILNEQSVITLNYMAN
jgi:hypothetical protein